MDPWKKDEVDMTNLALDDRIKVWGMNLVSRFVGFMVRAITISIGLLAIIFTVLAAIVCFAGFITFPIIIIFLLYLGLMGL